MRLLRQTKPQCLLYSAAMVLDSTPEDLSYEIGHDGLEKINNNNPPYCYKGIHIQEIQVCALKRGYLFAPYQSYPVSRIGDDTIVHDTICGQSPDERIVPFIHGRRGLLCGKNRLGIDHAVAFHDETIYDPIGCNYSVYDFNVREAWILCSVKQMR